MGKPKKPIYIRLAERVERIIVQLNRSFVVGGISMHPLVRVRKARALLRHAERLETLVFATIQKRPATETSLKPALEALRKALEKTEENIETFKERMGVKEKEPVYDEEGAAEDIA